MMEAFLSHFSSQLRDGSEIGLLDYLLSLKVVFDGGNSYPFKLQIYFKSLA